MKHIICSFKMKISLPRLGNLSVDALGISDLARLGESQWADTYVYSLWLGSLGLTRIITYHLSAGQLLTWTTGET